MKRLLILLLLMLPVLAWGQEITQQRQTPSSGASAGNQYFGWYGGKFNGYLIIPTWTNATANRQTPLNGQFGFQLSDSTGRVYYNGSWLPMGGGSASSIFFSSTYFNGLGTSISPLGIITNSVFPSQTGNSGKFLTTDGVNPSWETSTGGVTSITPGIGFVSHTPITSIGTMDVDTVSTVVGRRANGDVSIGGKLYPVKGFTSDSVSTITSNSPSSPTLTITQNGGPLAVGLTVNGGFIQNGLSLFQGQAEFQQYAQFDQSVDFEQPITFASVSGLINGKGFEWYTDPSNHWGLQYSTADSALHYSKNNSPVAGNRVALISDITGFGSGTVTSVGTGTGLTGGTITTSGTVAADTTVLQTVLNFFPKGDTRYAKVSSLPTGDNPTASIGFTAVNGSATTFTRSDGAAKADSSVIRSVANSYSLAGMQTKLNNYLLSSTAASTYAPIASPTFTGTAISPTYSAGTYTGATTNTNFTTNGGNSNSTLSLDFPQITSATGQVRIGRLTNTSGAFGVGIYKGDGTGTINAYVSGNSNSYINASTGVFTVGSATVGGSKFNVNGNVSIGSGQFTNAAPTDGLLVQGQINSLGGIKLSGNISASAGGNNTFTSVVGDNINQAAATYTDNSTASSTTITYRSANVFHQPTLAATNTSVVYTNAATLQIDAAPTAGTNVSISNPMAIYVLGGQSVFNGGVATASSGFFSNANFIGNTVASTTSISQYQFGGSTNVALRAGFYGSTSSTITSGYSYSAVNFASSPFTTASGSTTPWAANTVINSLGTVTLGGGGASLTKSASLYVGPAITTATNNYTAFFDIGGFGVAEGTNGRVGQTTLVAGTKAITITGLTTSSRAFVTLVSPSSASLTIQYQAVCTANTLTIQANVAAGTINVSDVSSLNYFVIN